MAFVPPKPRVLENSVTNHATVFALDAAADASYYRFSDYMSVGDTTEGAVVEPGVAFKVGILTYSAANQITITTTDTSKGTFGAGTKEIFMGPRAANWAELFDPITGVGNRLRFDAPQSLDAGQEAQGRTNLGLGDSATKNTGTTAGTVAAGDAAAQRSANLSDLASAETARTNLGLSASAIKDIGTTAGTLAAGDDSRFTEALALNGMQVNGNMDISQEYAAATVTLTNTVLIYVVDGWKAGYNNTAAVVTAGQIAAASFPTARPGFSYGLNLKATTALSSLANGDYAALWTSIEGWRTARLGWGAAGASPIAFMAQMYSTGAGVGFFRVVNNASNRFYYLEVTLAAGWNFVTGTIPGDTIGTWEKTTGVGMTIQFFAAGKEASPIAPNAWTATNATQTTNSVNLLDTANDQIIMTGFATFPGIDLPSSSRAAYIVRPYSIELDLARRYYRIISGRRWITGAGCVAADSNELDFQHHYVSDMDRMRVNPTPTLIGSEGTDYGVTSNATLLSGFAFSFVQPGMITAIKSGSAINQSAAAVLLATSSGRFQLDARL